VLFLGDGRIVDEMRHPTAEAVLERMKRFDVIRGASEDGGRAPGVEAGEGPALEKG
jgi:putative ABC transport system ATP-binding protein